MANIIEIQTYADAMREVQTAQRTQTKIDAFVMEQEAFNRLTARDGAKPRADRNGNDYSILGVPLQPKTA